MHSRATLVLIAAPLVWASSAHAQWLQFNNLCTTGAFQACASVWVKNGYDNVTGRHTVIVRVWNLNGLIGDPTVFSTVAVSRADATELMAESVEAKYHTRDNPSGQVLGS